MYERSFDEMIAYFNRRVSEMDIAQDCKAELFGMVVALGFKHEKSAQPNLPEAYSKAVFTWLMNYQIRAAELKGKYTPYEVLSWVANDWRKEHE